MSKKFLAIIPARGGSKRLPRKNILELKNKPLIAWTIEAALKSNYINKTIVSSDDSEILEIAKIFGSSLNKRPSTYSQDDSSTIDVVKYLLQEIKESFDFIVLLQPTSPLRTSKHIDEAIELLIKKNADAVISVSKTDHSPLWCNTIEDNLSMDDFLKEEILNKRSQDLETFYRLNGAIYICKISKLLEENSFFLKKNIFAYIMNRESSIDIDEKLDFLIAEKLIEENRID